MLKKPLVGIAPPDRLTGGIKTVAPRPTSSPKMPPASIKTPMGPRVAPQPRPAIVAARAVTGRATAGRKSIQPVNLGGRQRNRAF